VPARGKDTPPFPSAYALEDELKRTSHFSLRVSKNPRDGISRGPLEKGISASSDRLIGAGENEADLRAGLFLH
jgi:hypothetical protein